MCFSIFTKKVGKRQNLVSLYHPRKFFPKKIFLGFRATDHPINHFLFAFRAVLCSICSPKIKKNNFLGRYGDTKFRLFHTFFMKIEKDIRAIPVNNPPPLYKNPLKKYRSVQRGGGFLTGIALILLYHLPLMSVLSFWIFHEYHEPKCCS